MGKVIFSLCVSVHTSTRKGRGTPSGRGRLPPSFPMGVGGVPHQADRGYPPSFLTGEYLHPANGGYPHPSLWGYPILLNKGGILGYPSIGTGWGFPSPLGLDGVTPPPCQDWLGVPLIRTGWGYPSPQSGNRETEQHQLCCAYVVFLSSDLKRYLSHWDGPIIFFVCFSLGSVHIYA